MNKYSILRKNAIALRKQGFSYSEINKKIPVSKSTLSLWLRDIVLSAKAENRLKARMKLGQPYGARAQKTIRIEKTNKIVRSAKKDIGIINKRELFLIGTALYWAEGAKQKEHNPSQIVTFSNSDYKMIQIFIKWLIDCLKISRSRIKFEIYSHENIRQKEVEVVNHWSKVTGFTKNNFKKIRYKKDKKNDFRKNQGKDYFGLLRINVRKSTDLNRKITGWTQGICDNF